MLRRIQLENFKAFEKTELDLTDGNLGRANHVALMLGPNGGGKTSLVDSLTFLKLSVLTLDPRSGVNLHDMAVSSRRLGSADAPVLRFWISNGQEDGEYLMEFGQDGDIVHERLDYTINKNSGCIFDLYADIEGNTAFSRQLFKNIAAKDAFEYEVRKNWGRHTFLSILRREMREYGKARLSELLGTGVMDFVEYVDGIIVCRPGHDNLGPRPVDRRPESGCSNDEDSLERFIHAAELFINSVFGDRLSARYERDGNGGYRMVLKKGGLDIPLEEESQGIRQAVRLLPGLLSAARGGVAVIDDVEHCIHEAVLKTLFEECLGNISGQVIATTHCTTLLEDANPHGVFMVADGKITPITSIERTQKNHNNRTRYFKGVFGALPDPVPVDLAELAGAPANKNII